ncbi:MAG: sigma 54-interacting transcriptional regulator, partial [Acidobacteriota bacterium]
PGGADDASGVFRFAFCSASLAAVNLVRQADLPDVLWLPAAAEAPRAVPLAPSLRPGHGVDDMLAAMDLTALLLVPAAGGVLWLGRVGGRAFGDGETAGALAFAERVVEVASAPERLDTRAAQLARMEAVAALLPSLSAALDIREMFARLSETARRVLPHDVAVIALFSDDRRQVRLHALSRPTALGPIPDVMDNPYPPSLSDDWDFAIHHDLREHPLEKDMPIARAGFRSALRVPLRLEQGVSGILAFTAYEPRHYTIADLPVAKRIADYVTLALSHQRLADESRRSAALAERAANLEMLDGLLREITGVLDIRAVFDRISAIAKRVLPHDAMGLPIVTDDREHVIPFATVGMPPGTFPPITPLPDAVRPLVTAPWEFQIVNDIEEDGTPADAPMARLGYRSVLRVPVRLEEQVAGALVFFAKAPRAYAQPDVLVARRIADHVALALSHQRLAEQAQRNEQLRASAAQLELLDELLSALVVSEDLREGFDRMSAIAQKLLPHDAVVLPILLPDRRRARIYASTVRGGGTLPEVVDVPEEMHKHPDWEYDVVDDVQLHPEHANQDALRMGVRAVLRVPIRLSGQWAGALAFLSFTPGSFTVSDVPVARRIADRLAVPLAKEMGIRESKRADEAAERAARLASRVRALTDELDSRTGYRRIVGESAAWRRVLTQATQVAPTETTVLLLGESGTGKEVVARFLHRASARRDGPFVALNCAALPEQLLEAELFGYERGAFTGAAQSKPGQLEQAGGGTLFLDEVGEMSPAAQAKFLRVLQEREFQRLGGTRVLRTDARVIAATNRDLHGAMAQGHFREDLYYRLNVFAIALPPLRDRRDDVLPLSDAFLADIARGLGRPPSGVSRDARALLLEYHWPGNVRELRNILERAAILCEGGLITTEHLALHVSSARQPAAPATPTPETPPAPTPAPVAATEAGDLKSVERAMIEKALHRHRFNKSKAAKELGLTRAQFYVRMRRYGLE